MSFGDISRTMPRSQYAIVVVMIVDIMFPCIPVAFVFVAVVLPSLPRFIDFSFFLSPSTSRKTLASCARIEKCHMYIYIYI